MFLIKNNIIIIFTVLAMCSCDKEQPIAFFNGMETLEAANVTPTGIELWIDSSQQEVKLFRIRKANGASRMRLLVEMSDSIHFSLFLTPFEIGSQPIESGNVTDDIFKFSRTHCELKQQVDKSNFYLYEVDTAVASDNWVEITKIDSIQQIVSGKFQCQMKMVYSQDNSTIQPLNINGTFNSSYRD